MHNIAHTPQNQEGYVLYQNSLVIERYSILFQDVYNKFIVKSRCIFLNY